MSMWKDVVLYAGGIMLPNAVGLVNARSTTTVVQSDWYKNLKKAPFNPPRWVFPVAWTSLYSMMGTASVLAYKSAGGTMTPEVTCALTCYGAQLAINGCWSTIFFKWKRVGGALLWILLLDAAVAVTNSRLMVVSPAAGYLFLLELRMVLNRSLTKPSGPRYDRLFNENRRRDGAASYDPQLNLIESEGSKLNSKRWR